MWDHSTRIYINPPHTHRPPLQKQARRAGANNFPDVAGEVLGAVNALLLKHGVDCAPPLSLGVSRVTGIWFCFRSRVYVWWWHRYLPLNTHKPPQLQEAGAPSSYGAALLGLALQCFRHVQHREKEVRSFS